MSSLPILLGLLALACLAISALATGLVRRYAIRTRLLDHPNERSSHSAPTPRGGGLGIVIVASAAIALLWAASIVPARVALALLAGGGLLAIAGYLDDRHQLGVRVRLLVQLAAAGLAMWLLGGMAPLQLGTQLGRPGVERLRRRRARHHLVRHLFNFMDGIDGLAGSEAVFVSAAGAAFVLAGGAAPGLAAIGAALAGASAGFLVWNWAPARIFMGDVGSNYLGFCLAVLTLAAGQLQPSWLWVWLILAAVFIVDATVTLVRRLVRGERVHQAHRSHAYQQLSRRWRSHSRVTLAVCRDQLAGAVALRMARVFASRVCRLDLCGSACSRGRARRCGEGGHAREVSPACPFRNDSGKSVRSTCRKYASPSCGQIRKRGYVNNARILNRLLKHPQNGDMQPTGLRFVTES